MIRALFINPPFKSENGKYSRASRSPAITKSGTVYYPIWLAYAGANADAQDDIEVLFIDAVADGSSIEKTVERAIPFSPNLVVVDTSTPSIHEDVRCAAAIKSSIPDTFIALMGTHASAIPEETLSMDLSLDAIIQNEADETVVELARAIRDDRELSEVAGLIYRKGKEIIKSPARPLIQDLDTLPMVSKFYDKNLDVNDYFFSAARYPMVMIMTSRGCPFKCSWCVYPRVTHQDKYRMRSPENIVAEFQYIRDHMPHIQEIGIEDDLFTASIKHVNKVCDLLIADGNSLPWWVDTRVSLPYETMEKMKRAGCRLLIAGFESGDQNILDGIEKGTQLDEAYTFMANARKLNFIVHGCFVFGQPGETFETMNKTLELSKKLNPDTAQFFPMMIYPGTAAYRWAQEGGYMTTQNFNHWLTPEGLHKSLITTPEFDADEVTRFCDDARRGFYLRPRYIMKKAIQSILSQEERRRNFKAFRTLIRFLFRKPKLAHA